MPPGECESVVVKFDVANLRAFRGWAWRCPPASSARTPFRIIIMIIIACPGFSSYIAKSKRLLTMIGELLSF